ncbi:MAG: DMT family transporter [Anaerolineales bacterium]|nr:DMT family transporter [Anaerolineales bacterium]MDW8162987.1 EamA family transporter [Anaerolineales bacterium]
MDGISTTLLSVFVGLGGMLGWGVYDFLGGVFAKQVGPFKAFFWSQLVGFLSLLFLAFFLFSGLQPSILIGSLCAVAAVIYAAGYLFFFRGFEIGNVSIVAATMNLWAVFTMLFAFLFMGQRLSSLQALGVTLIIGGATLASLRWDALRNQNVRLSAGVREAVIGAFLFGVFWNVSEFISEQIGWLFSTLAIKLGIVLFLSSFSLLAKRGIRMCGAKAQTRATILLMGVIEAGTVALVNYGLTIGEAILITPISSALSMVTIALAILFLKENVTRLQATGMILAVTGIILTAF